MEIKLDKKDMDILKILDENFRTPLSKIAKKVGLSKNAVALRFEKLSNLISHTTTGINNKLLGYSLVKVYYSLDFLDDNTIKEIKDQFTKHTNLLYVATLYGRYNMEIAFFIKDIGDLVRELKEFNKRFSKKINKKEIQIVVDQFYLGNTFLYGGQSKSVSEIFPVKERIELTNAEKKILSIIRNNPRISLINLAEKTKLTPKTVSTNLKSLEKRKIILGYYMAINPSMLGLCTFKLLLQIQGIKDTREFEKSLVSIKNAKHISRQIGLWDYEIDLVFNNILELQEQIELLKQKFPRLIKKIEIISFGRRLITSKEMFLR